MGSVPMVFNGKYSPVGIDFGTTNIKVIQFREERKKVFVHRAFIMPGSSRSVPVGGDKEYDRQLALKLKERLRTEGFAKKKANLCIGNRRFIIRSFRLPPMADKDIPGAVRWEAEHKLAMPVTDQITDYICGREKNSEGKESIVVHLVAAPLSFVADYLNIMVVAGLRPSAVEIESFALTRLWRAGRRFKSEEAGAKKQDTEGNSQDTGTKQQNTGAKMQEGRGDTGDTVEVKNGRQILSERQYNAGTGYHRERNTVTLLLDIGGESSNVVVLEDGRYAYCRHFGNGINHAMSGLDTGKKIPEISNDNSCKALFAEDALEIPGIKRVFSAIKEEVNRTLELYRYRIRDKEGEPFCREIYLCGGGANTVGIESVFRDIAADGSDSFNVFDALETGATPDFSPGEKLLFNVAGGLALRGWISDER